MLAVILVSMWLGYLLGKKRMEKLNQRPQPRQLEPSRPPPQPAHIAPTYDIQRLLHDQHVRSYRQGWDNAVEQLTIHNPKLLPPKE